MRNYTKIRMSPRLLMGVGRVQNWQSLGKRATTALVTVIFLVLVIQVLPKTKGAEQGQVLGAQSSSQTRGTEIFGSHKVGSGETLFTIAQNYNISWTALATLNNLEPPFVIQPGQTLKVPTE